MTGYVEFTLVPAGTPIGQGGIVPDQRLGLASVTIVKQPGNSGVYGVPPAGSYTGGLRGFSLFVCHFFGMLAAACLNEASSCTLRGKAVANVDSELALLKDTVMAVMRVGSTGEIPVLRSRSVGLPKEATMSNALSGQS